MFFHSSQKHIGLQLTEEGHEDQCDMKAQVRLLMYGSSPAQPLNIVLSMYGTMRKHAIVSSSSGLNKHSQTVMK